MSVFLPMRCSFLAKCRERCRALFSGIQACSLLVLPSWAFSSFADSYVLQPLWAQSEFALASRTNKGPWAFSLLERFEVDDAGTTMDKLFRFKQIYTGSKRKHFEKLREETGVA